MKKKILCLDGGGTKGLFTAQVLFKIEDKLGTPIHEYFDMIVGTSTGGIIAAALSLGISPQIIRDLYINHAQDIFPQNKKVFRFLKRFVGAKFNNKMLEKQLTNVFRDNTINSCKTRLLIPSYNLTTGKVHVFKTSHSPDLYYDGEQKIVDVLLSTTAAPTFLPPYSLGRGTYIDGGIGAVNPSFIGIVEAVTRCQWKLDDIYMLSLGCMEPVADVPIGNEKMGFIDISRLISLFFKAESQYSDNIANLLLSEKRYLRINPIDPHNRISLDGTKPVVLDYLQEMGSDQAMTHIQQIKNMFFDKKADPFINCKKLE